MFARMEERTALMGAMIRRLEIDVAGACFVGKARAVETMARTCALCGNADRCRAWLTSNEAAGDAGYRRFCPNARRLDDLRA